MTKLPLPTLNFMLLGRKRGIHHTNSLIMENDGKQIKEEEI
jgi:hypothetical protein